LIDHLVTTRLGQDLAVLEAVDSLTAKTHVSRLLTKLGVQRRGQAAALTHRWGSLGCARRRTYPTPTAYPFGVVPQASHRAA
jgi:hypothetical protein